MRTYLMAALMLGIVALAGCGGGSGEAITDPSALTPLTEEQKAEIRARDTEIAEQEQQGGVVPE